MATTKIRTIRVELCCVLCFSSSLGSSGAVKLLYGDTRGAALLISWHLGRVDTAAAARWRQRRRRCPPASERPSRAWAGSPQRPRPRPRRATHTRRRRPSPRWRTDRPPASSPSPPRRCPGRAPPWRPSPRTAAAWSGATGRIWP